MPTIEARDPQWQTKMAVRLDFNAMLKPILGDAHGLDPQEIFGLQGDVDKVHRQITERTGRGSDFLGFLDLPYQSDDVLASIQATADRLASLGDMHVVMGIGGSYLGARALIEALTHPYRNELPRDARQDRPRIYWEGNNVDPDAMAALLGILPTSRPDRIERAFTLNVISKSGTTLETAVSFRIFHERMRQVYGAEYAPFIVATTDGSKGNLCNLAKQEGFETFVIPDNVGGRYSVLTPVGLLPAAVAGIDIRELLAGARFMAERCRTADLRQNPAYLYAALQYQAVKKGYDISLMAAWSKRLEFFGFWYDQLAAESLGKEEQGRVPITSVNTRDLHARGQQIQEGQRNTVVTNLLIATPGQDVEVPFVEGDPDGLNYVAGKKLSEVSRKALEGTVYAYAREGRPSMTLHIPELNAFTMGQLIYLFELSTVAEGYLMGINPLDQPGVEAYKRFMFANLGRADMQEARDEFEARPKGSPEFIV
jgi:glucose-6-phosphate isomerase